MTGSPSSHSSPPEQEKAEVSAPAQWEGLRAAPAVRSDGVPMYRRRTGRRVRGADASQPERSRGMQSARDVATVVMAGLLMTFVSQHVLVSGIWSPMRPWSRRCGQGTGCSPTCWI